MIDEFSADEQRAALEIDSTKVPERVGDEIMWKYAYRLVCGVQEPPPFHPNCRCSATQAYADENPWGIGIDEWLRRTFENMRPEDL